MSPNELKKKYADDDKSPVKSFIYLEKTSSIKLILNIDENLRSIYGFLSGTMLLSEDVQKLASQLMQQQVSAWALVGGCSDRGAMEI